MQTNPTKKVARFNGYIITTCLFSTTRHKGFNATFFSDCAGSFDNDGARRRCSRCARWTEKGGSYRTVQRFFATELPWTKLLVKFFRTHLCSAEDEFILAGDATTITKSGKLTHGIGRFFRGFARHVVSGLEFFVFSLVDVAERKAYPLCVKQTVRREAEKAAIKLRQKKRSKKSKPKPKGRPKGSLNKDKKELNLSPELLRINKLLSDLLKLLRIFVKIKYVALDGHARTPSSSFNVEKKRLASDFKDAKRCGTL